MILHKPVLLKEVLDFVPLNAQLIVDATLGHGGHALEMQKKLSKNGMFIGIDIDLVMLNKAKSFLEKLDNGSLKIVHDSYAHIQTILEQKKADFILLDLGVNLEHFKDGSRGFSIKKNAFLDMRYDQNMKKNASDIINTYNAKELAKLFVFYGDFTEKRAQELAGAIVKARIKSKIQTTFDLKNVLYHCGLGEKACAVIFQCLRIETNQEIQNLKSFLIQLPHILSFKGRCAIISYHSIEDRLVKTFFKKLEETQQFIILTPKPLQAHYTEVQKNKASRSAKLRVIECVKK